LFVIAQHMNAPHQDVPTFAQPQQYAVGDATWSPIILGAGEVHNVFKLAGDTAWAMGGAQA
jgi:hypothetical protein